MFEHKIKILKDTNSRLLCMKADPYLEIVVGLNICSSIIIAATKPFVTNSVDKLGVLLYFVIASFFLNT